MHACGLVTCNRALSILEVGSWLAEARGGPRKYHLTELLSKFREKGIITIIGIDHIDLSLHYCTCIS